MTIYDCFIVYDEVDMIRIREAELRGVPNLIHVAVEAPHDFRNRSKPLFVADSGVAEELERLQVSSVDFEGDEASLAKRVNNHELYPWFREKDHRDLVQDALRDNLHPADDDLIILSDADEIPRASILPTVMEVTKNGPTHLTIRCHCYSPQWAWVVDDAGGHNSRPIAFRWRDRWPSFDDMRAEWHIPSLPDGGWHLSWWNSPERAIQKITTFSHTEYDEQEVIQQIHERMATGKYPVGGDDLLPWDGSDMPQGVAALVLNRTL